MPISVSYLVRFPFLVLSLLEVPKRSDSQCVSLSLVPITYLWYLMSSLRIFFFFVIIYFYLISLFFIYLFIGYFIVIAYVSRYRAMWPMQLQWNDRRPIGQDFITSIISSSISYCFLLFVCLTTQLHFFLA